MKHLTDEEYFEIKVAEARGTCVFLVICQFVCFLHMVALMKSKCQEKVKKHCTHHVEEKDIQGELFNRYTTLEQAALELDVCVCVDCHM